LCWVDLLRAQSAPIYILESCQNYARVRVAAVIGDRIVDGILSVYDLRFSAALRYLIFTLLPYKSPFVPDTIKGQLFYS
jgi:hypothetical protein